MRLLYVGLWFLCAACSSRNTENTGTTIDSKCYVPKDQDNTLYASWTLTPVSIAWSSQSSFSTTETAALQSAADTWNAFFQGSFSWPIFTYANPQGSDGNVPNGLVSQARGMDPPFCSDALANGQQGSIINNGQFIQSVVVYKATQADWTTTGLPSDIYAYSFLCVTPNASYDPTSTTPGGNLMPQNFYNGVILLNYANWFGGGGSSGPDLQSIALHELGHVLGLYHSCETSQQGVGIPYCQDPNINPTYLEAVMVPSLAPDATRQTLTDNDETRANCVYKN